MKEIINRFYSPDNKGGAGEEPTNPEKKDDDRFSSHTKNLIENNPLVSKHKPDYPNSSSTQRYDHKTPTILKQIRKTNEDQQAIKKGLTPVN